MKLFLLRHAQAKDTFPDEERCLSDRGLAQLNKLSQSLSKELFASVAQVWHSPYRRAKESAEVFSEKMGIEAPKIVSTAITPFGDAYTLARTIASMSCFGADLLIVSHNPLLESLASNLLDARHGYVNFRKSTLACLSLVGCPNEDVPEGKWALDFLISALVLD